MDQIKAQQEKAAAAKKAAEAGEASSATYGQFEAAGSFRCRAQTRASRRHEPRMTRLRAKRAGSRVRTAVTPSTIQTRLLSKGK